MLVKNPITPQLYKYGYNGIDNVYDYWITYREELMPILKRKKQITFPDDLIAFEHKIRWATFYGLWFRFYIRMHLREPKRILDFNDIPIKFGQMVVVLSDFIDDISFLVEPCDITDLRGLSLINYTFKDRVIENVDFSYGALDSSKFENVSFRNCRFHGTSFVGVKIKNCCFDDLCLMSHNDFTNAFIDGDFQCTIDRPKIKKPNLFDVIRLMFDKEPLFLQHTQIKNNTFKNRSCHTQII